MVLLGGRAAEELIFGSDKISTGAQGDITQTTEIALSMIAEYGMGETLGLLKLSSLGSLSNSYGQPVVDECKALINSLYKETLELLKDNHRTLNNLANTLLEEETLEGDIIQELFKS